VAVVAIALGVVFFVPRLRRFTREKVWPQVLGAVRNIWGILTNPRQLTYVLGGSIASQLLYAASAAVITHRLFTTYLPPIWGSYATKRLVADGYL